MLPPSVPSAFGQPANSGGESPLAICRFACADEDDFIRVLGQPYRHFHEAGNLELPHIQPEIIAEDADFSIAITSATAYRLPVAKYIAQHLTSHFTLPHNMQIALHTCLHEAIANAVTHGNLELHSDHKCLNAMHTHYQTIEMRLNDPYYAARLVRIRAGVIADSFTVSISDEGKGYVPEDVQQPNLPAGSVHGIGLFIVKALAHDVQVRDEGRTLQMAFRHTQAQTPATADTPLRDRIHSSRILIVDDTAFNRIMLREVLSVHGFNQIDCANNGREAMEMTRALQPDLVLLDLMMPDMDGFAYCREIRKLAQFKTLPIVVQTALGAQEQRNKAFSAGATDLIIKPINSGELIARIHIHLERKHLLSDLQMYQMRMASEMQEAREMQNNLMPSSLTLKEIEHRFGMHIACHFEPSSEIGGDFWGVKTLDDHRIALYMCDFSGHGVSAALNTFRLHALMQEIMLAHGTSPGEYLSALNQHLYPLIGRIHFATLFYAVLNIHTDTLHYAAAAAPSPLLLWHGKTEPMAIDTTGVPIGVLPDTRYTTAVLPMGKGDTLVLYSDALTETPNRSHQCLTQSDIGKCLYESRASAPASTETVPGHILKGLLNAFHAHTQQPLTDDLTLTVYHRG